MMLTKITINLKKADNKQLKNHYFCTLLNTLLNKS